MTDSHLALVVAALLIAVPFGGWVESFRLRRLGVTVPPRGGNAVAVALGLIGVAVLTTIVGLLA